MGELDAAEHPLSAMVAAAMTAMALTIMGEMVTGVYEEIVFAMFGLRSA